MDAPFDLAGPRAGLAKPHKSFAVAFAVLAATLAGCASGLGAKGHDLASATSALRVEEGTIIQISEQANQQATYAVRMSTGELVMVAGADAARFNTGTPVLLRYQAGAPKIALNS